MKPDRFDRLLDFLRRLDLAKIPHTIADHRGEAVTVIVFAPGEYWEVDFLADGGIDVERFRSDGTIAGEEALSELFAVWADDQPNPEKATPSHDAVA